MELFKILGTIAIENSEANAALSETSNKAKDTADDINDLSNSGTKTGGKLSGAFSKIGSAAVAVGKTVAAGLAVGATAISAVTVKALNSAGELEQNMGGSEAVFGQYAERMQETAGTAFKNMGLSASDFLATSNKMGALFQGAGFGIEESATISADAMQRAADVASIMGIDTASAMESIAGAAKGNFTMMDNLGVAMNDTTLNAYALEKGIGKTTQEMTNQEKIGLAMELFMEKTAYAAGNYAKENETLAGSLGTAKAALTNFISGAGSVDDVVTSFTNAANVIVSNIETLFPKLMDGITKIVQQLVPQIPPLLQKLLPSLIEGSTALINGIVESMPALVSALLGAVPALIDGMIQIINAIIAALPQLMEILIAALPALIPQLVSGLVQMIVMLCTMLPQVIQPIIDYLPEIIVSIVTALIQNLPALLAGIGQLIVGIVQAIPQLLSALWEAITTLASDFANNLFGKIEGWIRQLFPKSADTVLSILKTMQNAFSTLISNIKEILSVVVDVVATPFKLAWNAIKLVWDTVVDFFKMIWKNIKAVFSVVDSVLAGDFKGAWDGIKKIWSNVGDFFKDIVSNIKNAFSNVGEILAAPVRKGKDAIKDIIDNIKGFFKNLKLEFPKIKLPHFSISGSFSLSPPSVPKLSIDWYKKAMDNAMLLTSPTIFGYNAATGNLMGGGEAGDEVVSGANTLMGMIRNAVSSENGNLAYLLQQLLALLADYFPQVLEAMERDVVLDTGATVGALAVPMNQALGKITSRKERGR